MNETNVKSGIPKLHGKQVYIVVNNVWKDACPITLKNSVIANNPKETSRHYLFQFNPVTLVIFNKMSRKLSCSFLSINNLAPKAYRSKSAYIYIYTPLGFFSCVLHTKLYYTSQAL